MLQSAADWNHLRRVAGIVLRNPRKLGSLLRLRSGRINPHPAAPIPPPRVVSLRLSEDCNLRCRMCHYWGDRGLHTGAVAALPERRLATREVLDLLERLAAFRPYLYITGGEPLLLPDLAVILRRASRLGIPTGMSSNGTLLADRCDELLRAGLDYLYVSLDEPPSGPGSVRRRPGGGDSRPQAVDGIRKLLARRETISMGLPLVQVQTVLVAESARRLREMAAWLAGGLRPDVWGIQPAVYTTAELYAEADEQWQRRVRTSPRHWQGFIADHGDMDMDRLDRDLAWLKRQKFPFRLRLYPPIGWPGFTARRWFTQPEIPPADPVTTCLNPWLFAQIQPDGSLSCCGSQPDAVLGNVRRSDFLALWQGTRMRQWRNTVREERFKTCSRCFSRFEYHHYSDRRDS